MIATKTNLVMETCLSSRDETSRESPLFSKSSDARSDFRVDILDALHVGRTNIAQHHAITTHLLVQQVSLWS